MHLWAKTDQIAIIFVDFLDDRTLDLIIILVKRIATSLTDIFRL